MEGDGWREVNKVEMYSRKDFPPSGTVKSPSQFGNLNFHRKRRDSGKNAFNVNNIAVSV